MTEDHFDEKKAGENGEDEGSGKKKTPRKGKLKELVEEDMASIR